MPFLRKKGNEKPFKYIMGKKQHEHLKTISFDTDRLLNAVNHIICT